MSNRKLTIELSDEASQDQSIIMDALNGERSDSFCLMKGVNDEQHFTQPLL